MTEAELKKYKKKFKSIVYLKGEIKTAKNHISQLSRWDKNGSHKVAILKAIKILNTVRQQYLDKLNGIDYDHMMLSIRKATALFKKTNKSSFLAFDPFAKKKCIYCEKITAGGPYCDDCLQQVEEE